MGTEATRNGRHVLGYKGKFRGDTTQRAAFAADGKTGAELAVSLHRADKVKAVTGLSKETTFFHGDAYAPPLECRATISQLAYQPPTLLEPKTGAFLWTGSTKHNDHVPTNVLGSTTKLGSKRGEWWDDEERNMYATTSRVEQLSTTFDAAGNKTKRTPAPLTRPAALEEGGQPAQIGRRPNGFFNRELEGGYSDVRATHFRWYPSPAK